VETWIRLAIFALILLSFLRRISKARTRTNVPGPAPNAGTPGRITPTLLRPQQGKKDDFRDVPPPPENPELG